MADERRYREDEVREILDLATAPGRLGAAGESQEDGLTLAELQEIAAEVGVDAGRIARAAATVATRGGGVPRKRLLGLPVSVGHVVPLSRAPTDDEWALLVAELRSTFGARGKVVSSDLSYEWSNGNLHAFVEPSESGWRLRMGTTKGVARVRHAGAVAAFVLAAVVLAVYAVDGRLPQEFAVPILFALMGGVALGANALTLPTWAAEREAQMAHIADRARAIVGSDAPEAEAHP